MVKFQHTEQEIVDAMAFWNCDRKLAIDIINSDKARILKSKSS